MQKKGPFRKRAFFYGKSYSFFLSLPRNLRKGGKRCLSSQYYALTN